MSSVFEAPWFYWAIGVAVGFPVCLVFLTEVHNALLRRGNALAGPVHLLRSDILPLGALLILLVQAIQVSGEATPVRVVATVFGFVVLVLLLSGLKSTMFQGAPEGSWRKRIPSIFLDVARFALIAVGVGLILAYIWGAHIGGLFTALGVSSIVLGLTLQNSVGQIISGLLVLFEQPFQLGDWIETRAGGPSGRPRWVGLSKSTGVQRISTPPPASSSCPTRCWPRGASQTSAGHRVRTHWSSARCSRSTTRPTTSARR